MLKFSQEIKKFKPSLEVEKIQTSKESDHMTDLLDIIEKMATKTRENSKDKE